MREGGERRELESDLETGRAHLLELMERILPLVKMDEQKNMEFAQLTKDLKKTQTALDMKRLYKDIRRRLQDLDIGKSKQYTPEQAEELHRLQLELVNLPEYLD